MLETLTFTTAAMIAFAANSLLARAALGGLAIDAADYTAVRLISGAIALAALLAWPGRGRELRRPPGSWASAAALFGYAIAFSLAYLRLDVATGALVLFAAVQGTMVAWGTLKGDRPRPAELVGLVVAFGGFVYLLLPGLGTPDLVGSLLMIGSGVAWGVYSLRGRGSADPLGATTGNFLRAAAMSGPLLLLPGGTPLTVPGVALAVASGVVASGLGYAIWYRALPRLSTTQAAVVQLTVPVIAAFGAVVVLAESLSFRLGLAAALVLGGVALAILTRRR
jgi:drug/metabolite transporter (DMT)-like permease